MERSINLRGKTRQEKLEYLNSLQYDVLLRRKKGIFYLIIPELPLVTAHEDLGEAYKKLNIEKQDLFNEMLDCDAEDEIAVSRRTRNASDAAHQLKVFVCKLLIVCFLLGATFIFGGRAIMNNMAGISAGDIAKGAIKSIVSTFVDAPEEAKELRIERLRQLLKELRPVIEEFKNAFAPLNAEGEIKQDVVRE